MRQQSLSGARNAGFTLVELMIVIVIASILLTIAIPSYLGQMRKSRRTEARAGLLDLAQREERYMSTNSSYTTNPAQLGYSGTAFPINMSNNYQLSVCVGTILPCTGAAATGTTFLLTAAAINGQLKDNPCASLSLDNTGSQTAVNSAGTANPSCWTN
jgi:type IV pilus assembly protein PilE